MLHGSPKLELFKPWNYGYFFTFGTPSKYFLSIEVAISVYYKFLSLVYSQISWGVLSPVQMILNMFCLIKIYQEFIIWIVNISLEKLKKLIKCSLWDITIRKWSPVPCSHISSLYFSAFVSTTNRFITLSFGSFLVEKIKV